MAKRFTDTDLWDREWFMSLPAKLKLLVKLVREKADCAGVWDVNLTLAKYYTGEAVTIDELLNIDNGKQFVRIAHNKVYCVGFIEFQYGELSENCKPHKRIFAALKKHGIDEIFAQIGRAEQKNFAATEDVNEKIEDVNEGIEDVNKGYTKGIHTLQDKDLNKEEEKEEDKIKTNRAKKIEKAEPHPMLTYPIEFTDRFREMWRTWIEYKQDVHKFRYKNIQTEQAALHELVGYSPHEEDCIEIITYSIGRQYKGFYLPESIKNKKNGQSATAGGKILNADYKQQLAAEMARITGQG